MDSPERADRLDQILVLAVATLVVASAATLAVPSLAARFVADGLDLALDTITTVVALAVSVLAWVRYRERGQPVALVQSAAFLVLAVSNALAMLLDAGRLDDAGALAGLLPGQAPLYVSLVARLLAASLLVVGLSMSLRGVSTRHPWATLAAPVAGLIGVVILAQVFTANLPALSSPFVVAAGRPADVGTPLPASTPLGNLLNIVAAGLFLWAAVLSRRLYRRLGSIGDGYLALGLVFAGFAQFHLAVYPGTYPGLVTGGDLLRLAFDVALLLGIEAEARATLASLRQSNVTLGLLKDAEGQRAALEERTRLAREIHDGLAQDLWLAKLKVGRLEELPALGPEGTALCQELNDAIDGGLAEARQAVIALRWTGEAQTSFRDLMGSYVDDFADRFGVRVEFRCHPDLPAIGPRAEAELLRIAQEALTNVRRHADATVVRVRADIEAGRLRLDITDNGRGFDLASTGEGAFGLLSMRERAALIGGRLRVDSHPGDGTTVAVEVPVADVTLAAPSAP